MGRQSIRMQQMNEENRAEVAAERAPADPVTGNPFASMSWTKLRRYASDRGVVIWRRNRVDIEAELISNLQG